jgi:uncharacterized cupredoxin-like copper-binding protein
MYRSLVLPCLAVGAALTVACSSSGEGGRPVDVTQTDDGCTPATIQATPGEKLNLKVKNETGGIYEVEGIEGTDLEEVIVPEGRTREVGFNVPDEGGTSKIKCYQPGGVSTIIEVHAEGTGGATSSGGATATASDSAAADVTVHAELTEYTITPNVTSIDAGTIKFDAENVSASLVHELAVLVLKDNGSIGDVLGEIEDIDPGAGGTLTLEMTPGKYQLACLLVPGEAGSTVDHYQEGMHIDFEVK